MERQEPPRATRRDYASVFEGNPQGALVLEDLTRRFARGPVFEGGIDGVRKSDYRAGARSVVEYIVNKSNLADEFNEEPET